MARPNFYLHAAINRELSNVTLLHHTVNNCLMPEHVKQQVKAGKRIWTFDDYDHAVNVHIPDYGVMEFRWNCDSPALDSIPRGWLATQVWYFRQRNKIDRKAA